MMTVAKINSERNANGIFSTSNESAGWFAVSRDGINMITYYEGKWPFTIKEEVNKFYTETGFAKKLTSLLNKGW